jgi:hypothetical protein
MAICLVAGCGSALDATIGGTVYGLSGGTSVVLLDNGGDALTVSANGTFTFATQVQAPNAYNVTVGTQPTGETCSVSNGSGSVSQNSGNITNVAVTCYATPTANEYVFVTVYGLASGASVILLDNGANAQTVSKNGPFVFSNASTVGTLYSVTVGTNPSGQTCTVTNGSGTIPASGTNTAVVVSCS